MTENTESTYFFDYESPEIQELIAQFKNPALSDQEKAAGLYLKIRDGWRYNPYDIHFRKEALKASNIVQKKHGHCIDKSILYIAGLRGLGIPAKLHLAKVKNHIAVERLTEKFGTNELTPHGMVDVFIDGKWVKATPAFNAELCRLTGVEPLEFDGTADSIFQEYNQDGKEFMEYLEDYGSFDDVPFEFIQQNMEENYPKLKSLLNEAGELKL
ncbi:Transglutaminase-like superfamily protein [Ekhidna lutea]|uniref:Transglutaminase-like superfamily protein n=1 Tax=Ekhidna lutea TaxID=447679 RepID=A0A239HZ23_EKHLU|nr:transglutaminase family protein [Ekhidna lutea]SNS86726.1 Transglutaminase-like superfamily protein [Ekhidna lutea]